MIQIHEVGRLSSDIVLNYDTPVEDAYQPLPGSLPFNSSPLQPLPYGGDESSADKHDAVDIEELYEEKMRRLDTKEWLGLLATGLEDPRQAKIAHVGAVAARVAKQIDYWYKKELLLPETEVAAREYQANALREGTISRREHDSNLALLDGFIHKEDYELIDEDGGPTDRYFNTIGDTTDESTPDDIDYGDWPEDDEAPEQDSNLDDVQTPPVEFVNPYAEIGFTALLRNGVSRVSKLLRPLRRSHNRNRFAID